MRISLNFINIPVILSAHFGEVTQRTPLGRTLSQEEHKVCVPMGSVLYGNQDTLSLVEWDMPPVAC